jgi:hypothetical protein
MRMFLFELQERPNADADQKHAVDEPLSGAHAMEGTARLRRKQAGLPSTSTASATWFGENRRCAILLCAFPSGSAIKS